MDPPCAKPLQGLGKDSSPQNALWFLNEWLLPGSETEATAQTQLMPRCMTTVWASWPGSWRLVQEEDYVSHGTLQEFLFLLLLLSRKQLSSEGGELDTNLYWGSASLMMNPFSVACCLASWNCTLWFIVWDTLLYFNAVSTHWTH